MSVLTLVRHGQASYMSQNYDQLSATGEEQSVRLGQYWVRQGRRFDHVFHGPAQRHIRTMELVAGVYLDAALPFPQPQPIPDFDEFDAFQMLRRMTPILVEQHEHIRRRNEAFRAAQDTPDAGRLLELLFEDVARVWSLGNHETPELETWSQFRARISRAIGHVRSVTPKSAESVVFTSGGPIAATTGLALDLRPDRAIELVWSSRNSAYAEFLFSGDRFSLSSFNSFPHLEERSLLTYR